MKGAIASIELFASRAGEDTRRLTLTVGTPEREGDAGWVCRVALADLHRPESIVAPDSVSALAAALAQGRAWVDALEADGCVLTRDRAGTRPFAWP